MGLSSFQNSIVDRLKKYSEKEPEISFHWKDIFSSARGFLVINSLRGGAAGGGTRVHENININEVTALAKIMEIKFALSGPAIGGAKSGIRLDPADPNKYAVLERWYKAIKPLIRDYYGTGSDMNTDIHRINSLLHKMGIQNSQQGIIHAVTNSNSKLSKQAYNNMEILKKDVDILGQKIKLAELVTGYGVAYSVTSYYKQKGQDIVDKKVFIQGVGNVGAATAYYLKTSGASIIAVSDRDAAIIREQGLSEIEISNTLKHRRILNVLDNNLTHEEFNNKLPNLNIDIFVPAAGSNVVSKELIDMLNDNGLEVTCCGANHPFIEPEYCYGLCSQYIDSKTALIPDFLANMGMARTFYKLMTSNTSDVTIEKIFTDIRKIIEQSVSNSYALNNGKLITASIYDLALSNIENQPANHITRSIIAQ